MNSSDFQTRAEADGFEIERKTLEANVHNAAHTHDFDARLMVLDGTLTIEMDGRSTCYRAGESFDVERGRSHVERSGERGCTLLVGRRHG